MKHKTIIVIVAIIIVLSLFWWKSTNSTSEQAATITVTRGTVVDKVTAVGTIAPRQPITVKSAIAGTVAALYKDAGDFVKKGEDLLEVKPEPTPEQYAKAKQQVEIELSKERELKAEVDRYEFLMQKKAISKNDQNYSQANSKYEEAQLQRSLAEQQLALLEEGKAVIGGRQIANVIESPIEGFVLTRNVNLGDPVVAQSSSQPGNILFSIANMNDMIFKGQVSQVDAAKLQENMPASLQIAALPKQKIPSKLTKLALQSVQESDEQTGSTTNSTSSPFNVGFTVEISEMELPENIQLRAGYSANAEIIIKEATDSLIIPERVLYFDNDRPYVWLNQNDKVVQRFISIGISDGVNVEVTEGLTDKDEVFEVAPDGAKNIEEPTSKRRIRIR